MKRILVLTSTPREPDNHLLWEGLRRFAEVDIRFIEKKQQRNLRKIFASIDFSIYERVIMDLRFRYLSRHARILKPIQGLTIYEEDAYQDTMAGSRWHGRFSAFYRKIPHARIILTGFRVCEHFREMGFDARFLPKGFDSARIYAEGKERDIELGFIGRIGSSAYRQRRDLLEKAEQEFGLQVMRTRPGDEYRETLNRIRIFISADIGLNEYMAKNFEAMACGCILLAYRQGKGEEEALGLIDGKNLLLYDDYQEFTEKLTRVRTDDSLATRLAHEGEALAQQCFDYFKLSEKLYGYLCEPMQEAPPLGLADRILRRLLG